MGVEEQRQSVIYKGKILRAGALSSYGVADGATVVLCLKRAPLVGSVSVTTKAGAAPDLAAVVGEVAASLGLHADSATAAPAPWDANADLQAVLGSIANLHAEAGFTVGHGNQVDTTANLATVCTLLDVLQTRMQSLRTELLATTEPAALQATLSSGNLSTAVQQTSVMLSVLSNGLPGLPGVPASALTKRNARLAGCIDCGQLQGRVAVYASAAQEAVPPPHKRRRVAMPNTATTPVLCGGEADQGESELRRLSLSRVPSGKC
eukprot:TRINITY_DN1763_c0_g1_i2.p1 TRINITY_DN1763_c0_g1~~TRINITY_DN1763_c0_g1_i2.p1  ORF type:complete len:264 (+),score=68.85 TRINITY_DN1763_c0_g1_i2:1032-1823(+)